VRVRTGLVVAALVALLLAQPATGSSWITMDDGVEIGYELVRPEGARPSAGWPVVMLPGREMDVALGELFVQRGFAVLLYSTRGHSPSGGIADFAGPRDVADLRIVHDWLARQPEVSGTAIGAWGGSYSGGLILNALASGVPLAAAAVLETWTDLYAAFWPQGVAKTFPVGGLMAESSIFGPFAADAVRSRKLGALRPLLAARSSLRSLRRVRTPVYLAQGRVDWLFDIAQAEAAFARLVGPRKLYVGTFGHVPSPGLGTSPDTRYVIDQSAAWFDRFLRGVPNGIESPRVELAAAGGSRATASWTHLPATRTRTFGRSTRVRTAFETWGGGTVTVRVRKLHAYPRLVAVVTAGKTVLTHGAIKPRIGRNVIRLASHCVYVAKATRLQVALGPDSGADVAYARIPGESSGSISLGPPTLRLSVLPRPVTARVRARSSRARWQLAESSRSWSRSQRSAATKPDVGAVLPDAHEGRLRL
jgi:hypothetical protein